MKRKKIILILIIIFPLIKIFSQTNPLDPIIDTSANYSNNIEYNTGEVYVIYTIQTNQIVSKNENKIIENINELSNDKNISIYPNPVTNILIIKTSNDQKINNIKLYSMDGKLIIDKEIENNQIDLTDIKKGTYILKTDFSNSINFKLIKL